MLDEMLATGKISKVEIIIKIMERYKMTDKKCPKTWH